MAFVKSQTLVNGAVGNYWRVNELSYNAVSDEMRVRLDLYTNKAQRTAAVGYPLPQNATFLFCAGDHPISEIVLGASVPLSAQDIPTYLMYQHIRAVAIAASLLDEAHRTQNEHAAVWFADATNDM